MWLMTRYARMQNVSQTCQDEKELDLKRGKFAVVLDLKKNKIPYSDMELLIVRYKIRSHISATQKVIITNNTND